MLRSFRKASQSWAVRILMGLLVASFGLWGIGDIFRSGREPSVAQVGDVRITVTAFNRAFNNALEELRQRSGGAVTAEQARAAGLDNQVLFQLIGDSLIEHEAAWLGLRVPDSEVQRRIADTPYFLNPEGRFDPQLYHAVLQQLGLTPEQYEDRMRREGARAQLWNSVRAVPPAPETWVDVLYRYRHERRVAEYVLVPNERDYAIEDPSEDELKTFYDANGALFSAPEYRRATYVRFGPETLAAEIKPSDDDLYQDYESRLDEFQQPETRKVDQLLLPDEAAADEARELLKSGKTLAEVAQALAAKGAVLTPLGSIAEKDLPPEVGPTVFGLSKGGVSDALKTAFGWHFFWVRDIAPAKTQSFAEVRDKLAAEYSHQMALDGLYRMANSLEDTLAGGASLEEAAQRLNLPVSSVGPMDAKGLSPDGKPADLPPDEGFLDTLFSTDSGAESQLVETKDGDYYLLRVDETIPSGVRPFDQVRDEAARAWTAVQKAHAAENLAQAIAEKAAEGEPLDRLAKENGLEVETSAPLARQAGTGGQDAANILQPLLDGLFALNVGERKAVTASLGTGYVVATLKEIEPADPAADPGAVENERHDLAQSLAVDVMIAFQTALQKRFPVEVDLDTLKKLSPSDGG